MRIGFTLIEVLVAVMVVSVIIAAMIHLRANGVFLMQKTAQKEQNSGYCTFLLGSEYGFEKERFSLDDTAARFDMDDDLRKILRNITVKSSWQKVANFAFEDANASVALSIEIGKSTISFQDGGCSFYRIRPQ